MTTIILLTNEQADHVRGPSSEAPQMAALEPVALSDGRFMLSVAVLDDPAHGAHRDYLSALPTSEIEAISDLLPKES